MKSGVKTVVNSADIIRQDKDIYINLYNTYKKKIESESFFEKIKTISEMQKNDKEYLDLSEISQEKLFLDLMSIKNIRR